MDRKQETARDYVNQDLLDALAHVEDARKLLAETGLPDSPRLADELRAAHSALGTARRTYRNLVRGEETDQ